MRTAITCAAMLAACSLGPDAGAQTRNPTSGKSITKQETVVIRKDGADRTVIEIRDGAVYVNGDEVASLKDGNDRNLRKKIVIEDGNGGGSREWPTDGETATGPQRAALGVYTDPSSRKEGALLKEVSPGSAAEKAGLRAGDLITSVDGRDVMSAEELVDAISGRHKPGDEVLIGYERGGKSREIKAVLGSATARTAMRNFRFGPEGGMNMPQMPGRMFRQFPGDDMMPGDEPAPKLGVSAEDRADGNGVRILAVRPGSPAATAGLKEGDVLTRVDNESIGSVDELQSNIRGHKPGDRLDLNYERAGKPATAAVLLPKELKRRDL